MFIKTHYILCWRKFTPSRIILLAVTSSCCQKLVYLHSEVIWDTEERPGVIEWGWGTENLLCLHSLFAPSILSAGLAKMNLSHWPIYVRGHWSSAKRVSETTALMLIMCVFEITWCFHGIWGLIHNDLLLFKDNHDGILSRLLEKTKTWKNKYQTTVTKIVHLTPWQGY